MPSRLKDKWIIITGASSGFGAAAAKAFAAEGARLLLGARRLGKLETVAKESKEMGAAEAHFHPLDVSKTDSVRAFAAWTDGLVKTGASKGVHVLVNNAGGAHGLDPVATARDEDWETMFQVNTLGVLRMIRGILPLIPHHTGATIINIGSYAGYVAYEGGAAYCAAKAGERKITEALRLELCGTGIRVSSIDPGLAETEFSLVRFKGDAERAKKVYEGTEPLTPENIAETMVWVASRPPNMNVDQMLIKATDQAAAHKVHRRK